MIPKKIHYCWFGKNQKSKLIKKCIDSWAKYCPDYEIIEWNEENVNIDELPLYLRKAYEQKMWAYISDYVRYLVVYENGGIYFDTDVELKKSIDPFLKNKAFAGFDDTFSVASGVGFGAEKGFALLGELINRYKNRKVEFEDGHLTIQTNVEFEKTFYIEKGLLPNGELQTIYDLTIYPKDYFCPTSNGVTKIEITKNTYAIHWYTGSWLTEEQQKEAKKFRHYVKTKNAVHYIKHIPNRLVKNILGGEKYQKLKGQVKK